MNRLPGKSIYNKKKTKIPNSKHFISSFIVDALVLAAVLLTVIISFIVLYMISGQLKLKTLVTNIALQCIKAIEAFNPNVQHTHCDLGMLKFIIILILIGVIILIIGKFRKSRIFKGQWFLNMVKIKLFIADTQSCVPIDLNKIAGNVHLFKLTDALLLENVTLKKNWIWDVLEIDWSDVCITLNEKEINLPISIVIPLVYKLKIRWLLKKKKLLHQYIMLKQRKFWFNLENSDQN